MKMRWIVMLAIAVMSAVGLVSAENAAWVVSINGNKTDIKPLDVQDVTYVPLQDTAKALGLSVKADDTSKTFLVTGPVGAPSEYGSVSGTVAIRMPSSKKPMNFDGVEVFLTAVDTSQDLDRALKLNFFGPDSSYFKDHPVLISGKIDHDGYFALTNVPPGNYDLLVFNKHTDTFGYQRAAWKLTIVVTAGNDTAVTLNRYDRAVFDYVLLQK